MGKRLIIAFDVIDDNGQSSLSDDMYFNGLEIPMGINQFNKEDSFITHTALLDAIQQICHWDDFIHLFPNFNSTLSDVEELNDNIVHRFGHTTFEYSPTRMIFSHRNKDDQIVQADNSLHE